jgi:hypothetical protein
MCRETDPIHASTSAAVAPRRERRYAQVKGVNLPLASTTPKVPFTLQSFSPALVPAGGAASGRSNSDPSGSNAKIVSPVGST